VHETADREHGELALELVLRHARTREQQERCIAEARAGAQAWMDAHGGRAL
jgi:pyrroloquinoline quinone (PQQ) biosynthesis protein C